MPCGPDGEASVDFRTTDPETLGSITAYDNMSDNMADQSLVSIMGSVVSAHCNPNTTITFVLTP